MTHWTVWLERWSGYLSSTVRRQAVLHLFFVTLNFFLAFGQESRIRISMSGMHLLCLKEFAQNGSVSIV